MDLLRWLWEHWNSEVGDSDAGSDEVMESEDGQLYRLEIKNRKGILIVSQGKGSHKGGGKEGKTDTECYQCGARWPHQSSIAEPNPTSTEVLRSQLSVAMNGVGNCQDEEQETHGHVPLRTIELGSFEVVSDYGHTTEDIEDIDEFPEEPTETMLPPPPS